MNTEQGPIVLASSYIPRLIISLTGGCQMLLLARLLARLLAARPDNPAIQVLYALTDPLVLPLRSLDAQQPRFGSLLEFSTLALLVILPVLGYLLWQCYAQRAGANYG